MGHAPGSSFYPPSPAFLKKEKKKSWWKMSNFFFSNFAIENWRFSAFFSQNDIF